MRKLFFFSPGAKDDEKTVDEGEKIRAAAVGKEARAGECAPLTSYQDNGKLSYFLSWRTSSRTFSKRRERQRVRERGGEKIQ